MSNATRLVSNRIAVVFDFDETLTPEDSFQSLLRHLEIEVDAFESERIQPLLDKGWEKYLARAYCLVKESQQRDRNITQQDLQQVGQSITLYPGVENLFEQLKMALKEISPQIELEFYLISGGFVDIPKHSSLAKNFRCMWGCQLHYNEAGAIEFIKYQMTHIEKTRYLYYLSKGIDRENGKDLVYNYRDISEEKLYLPLEQMIYVGDGASDIPCFAVMKQYHGLAIGTHKQGASAQDWQHLEGISRGQKLSNLVPASYEPDSELVQSLCLGIESIAKRIVIRQINAEK